MSTSAVTWVRTSATACTHKVRRRLPTNTIQDRGTRPPAGARSFGSRSLGVARTAGARSRTTEGVAGTAQRATPLRACGPRRGSRDPRLGGWTTRQQPRRHGTRYLDRWAAGARGRNPRSANTPGVPPPWVCQRRDAACDGCPLARSTGRVGITALLGNGCAVLSESRMGSHQRTSLVRGSRRRRGQLHRAVAAMSSDGPCSSRRTHTRRHGRPMWAPLVSPLS
jgi:hypothetical protein